MAKRPDEVTFTFTLSRELRDAAIVIAAQRRIPVGTILRDHLTAYVLEQQSILAKHGVETVK